MHVHTSYDMMLVVLSYVISTLGAFTALRLAMRIPTCPKESLFGWLLGAALALGGGGIWSMHFIAMLACQMEMPVSYDVGLTALSLVIAVLVTGVGLLVVGRGAGSFSTLLGGGTFTGLGVAGMHYTGMAAMRMGATIQYNSTVVLISVVIAVVAATAALWLAFNLRGTAQMVGSALVMGVAVCGMHYTGMAAVTMVPNQTPVLTAMSMLPSTLALLIFVVTLVVLSGLLMLSNTQSRQLAAYNSF